MGIDGKASNRQTVREDIQADEVSDTNHMSVDELRRRQDSLIENIGAMRFSIARIEYLEGYQVLFRDLLIDCRIIVEAHGHKTLVKQIDKILRETKPNEPTVQTPG